MLAVKNEEGTTETSKITGEDRLAVWLSHDSSDTLIRV